MSSDVYLTANTKPLARSPDWLLGFIFENIGNIAVVIR
jgi:hypothetical protein